MLTMKICMYSIDQVFQMHTGGVRRFVELMNALIDAGHDVTLYSADDQENYAKQGIKGFSIKTNENQKKQMIGLRSAFGNKEIFKKIRIEKYDRVIVFDVRAAFSLVVNNITNIYLFLRQDLISYKRIQLQNRNINTIAQGIILYISNITETLCLMRSNKVVVQCKYDLDSLLKRHPFIRKKVEEKSVVQINNVNPSWIGKNDNIISDSAKKYDIVFIGNFKDTRKGHDILLEVVKKIIDEGHNIHVAIIGDGKLLEEEKNKYSCYTSIEFLGRLNNPIPILMNSALLVVPSYADSCPNTVMEGLFYNVPVIGSNRGGIPEILMNREWLFEPNAESLKLKIEDVINNDNLKILKEKQLIRSKELTFDWGYRMRLIVESV